MNFKRLSFSFVLATAGLMAANAGNIDVNAARMAANSFVKQNLSTKGMLKAPSMADIKLAHTEASSVEGNAYYVFNIQGSGWVIIAGDDRAKQVLAYGDKGNLDMNDLPGNMKDYLILYKNQIEEMQSYKGNVVPIKAPNRTTVVEPLTKSIWGQSNPFNRQCPQLSDGYPPVGCGPLAMAQILYYWKYPTNLPALANYYIYQSWMTVPELPADTLDYSLLLDAYTAWNDAGQLTLLPATDEQKAEVAKLCRYCAQACLVRFASDGSGSYSYDQRDGFGKMGFQSDYKLVGIQPSYYCDNNTAYTEEEWKALICDELENGRPIAYHNVDFIDGHAWVLDGVDADGKFHMNWGWYEKCNGWFEFGAFTVAPQGETWNFNGSGNEMVINLYPYEGYIIPGQTTTIRPIINYTMNSYSVTFRAEGEGEVRLYIDGEEVENPYTMNFSSAEATVVVTATAQKEGYAVSNPAEKTFLVPAITSKRGDVNGDGNVSIADVTTLVDYLLGNDGVIDLRANVNYVDGISIADATTLIDYLLGGNW